MKRLRWLGRIYLRGQRPSRDETVRLRFSDCEAGEAVRFSA